MRQFGSILKHQTWLPPWTYSSTRYKWQGSSRVININATLSLSMWKHTQKHTYTHTHTYTYTHLLSIYIFIHMKLWSLSRVYKVDTESQTIRASNVHTWFRSNLDFAWPWAPTCDPVDVPYTGKHCMTNIRHTNITPHTSIHCLANISVWL